MAAWIGVVAVMAAGLVAPPAAIADEPCVDPAPATTLTAGTPLQGALSWSAEVDVFVFEVAEDDTTVTLSLTDPYERLEPFLDSSCSIDIGGGGRHADGGGWSRVDDTWVLTFDAGSHAGDYYVTVAPDAANTTFPATFAIGVELAN